MIEVTLEQIKEWIPSEIDNDYLDYTINVVSIDSRKIEEKNLFITFKGEHVDGHKYVVQALKDGAGAAFYQKANAMDREISGPIIWVDDTLEALQKLAKTYLAFFKYYVVAMNDSNVITTTNTLF